MKEIRIHARAGQGAITIASILADALFQEGKFAFAFPHFGAARMGAPMNAFIRVDDKPIRLRSQIYEPDYIIVVDATLLRGFNVFEGFKPGGIAVVDGREGIEVPELKGNQKIFIVPGSKIAMEVMGRALGNTALLGAFVAATQIVSFPSLEEAIKRRFTGKTGELNAECARRGYEYLRKEA